MTNLIDLIHKAEQASAVAWVQAGGSNRMSPRKLEILKVVAKHPGGINQTSITEKTGIDRSTLADIVRRMADDGYLKRDRDKNDNRSIIVRLGFKGKEALASMEKVSAVANGVLLRSIPPSLLEDLENALTRMVAFEPWTDAVSVLEKPKSKGRTGRVSAA
jgi:DNA-binding MarR family transcriptional regulator